MVMRRILISLFGMMFMFFLSSCESGNLVAYYEISGKPDRIVYIANIDTTIDLSGLKTIIHYRDGSTIEEPLGVITDSGISGGYKVHEVDFTKSGVYEVDLSFDWRYIGFTSFQSKDMTLSYKYFIQVIDDDTYNTLKESSKE